jgi:putative FmdB family regulatory protein
MPIYEYACTACGERTEAKQGFDDPPLTVCPICGGVLRKLYSPVGIVFKGSGFYSTDKKKPSAASRDTKPAADKPKTETKSETKSETKKDPPPKPAEKSA